MNSGRLKVCALQLREWAVMDALPLWATAGFEPSTGRFFESLTMDGKPIRDVPTRLIVQARQIYCYALAVQRGWFPSGREVVERAYTAMFRDYAGPGGRGGLAYSMLPSGEVIDDRRDFYSHAFVLLATSGYFAVTGHREALAVAKGILGFLDVEMRAPHSGGYAEGLPATPALRRQNPHMHLFEALLSLWTNTGQGEYLGRAGEIFGLFSTRFFRGEAGTLGEYFNQALEPADGETGEIVEPGHHCEWIWLLRWFQQETGREVQPYVDALYDHVAKFGYDDAGLLVDEVLVNGHQRLPTHRVWPITEAIKANAVEARHGRAGAAAKAAELGQLLLERFLRIAYVGGWMDRLDRKCLPSAKNIPASTLYHVLSAIDELERAAQAL